MYAYLHFLARGGELTLHGVHLLESHRHQVQHPVRDRAMKVRLVVEAVGAKPRRHAGAVAVVQQQALGQQRYLG